MRKRREWMLLLLGLGLALWPTPAQAMHLSEGIRPAGGEYRVDGRARGL